MKKDSSTIFLIILATVVFVAIIYGVYKLNLSDGRLSEVQARAIAEKSCIKGGESLAAGQYNENSKTWWYDANLNNTHAGCNPACVVSEETRQAEINWRCTGAVLPATTTTPIGEFSDLIKVSAPQKNQSVSSPIEISGQARGAWYFEADFPVRLIDAQGKILAQAPVTAQGDWMTNDFVPFLGSIGYQVLATTSATLVLENSNPSGLPENQKKIEIPLVLTPSESASSETLDVKAFFMNNNLDPEVTCTKVFPVIRQIAKTQAVASSAIAELLRGPTEAEKADGYSTTINPGVRVQSLSIVDGVARIDFDKAIENGVGGSCRVSAIRSEISETLKQFTSVKEVVISVDGRKEDALQP